MTVWPRARILRPFVLVSTLIAVGLAAQQRVPVVGRTHLADGAAWPGATIVLQSFVHPEWPQLGVTDRVEARSDAQGHFRADALPGRSYVTFAFELDEQRRHRCSQLANAGPAQPVELQARHDWLEPLTLRLLNTASHDARRPLRVHWPAGFAMPSDVDADGRVLLPPLPTPFAEVSVTTADGHLLMRSMIGTRSQDTIELPPASPFLVRALDGPSGKPVAAAEVLLCWDFHEERLATTAADGFAIVDLACLRHGEKIDSVRFRLRVRAGGRELGLVQVTDERSRTLDDLNAMRARGECQAFATLPKGRRHRGRILLDATTPGAGLPLLVQSQAGVEHAPGARTSTKVVRLASTAIDGTFVLDDIASNGPLRVFVVLPPALAASFGPSAPALVPIANFTDSDTFLSIPEDLGTTRLPELRRFDLQLRTPDGAPTLDAVVFCAVPSRGTTPPISSPDRKGNFSLLLPPKVSVDVAIATSEASWLGRIGGLRSGDAITVPITLWADRAVQCVVEGSDGKVSPANLELATLMPVTPWQPQRDRIPGLVRVQDDVFLPMLEWLPTRSQRASDGSYQLRVPNVPGRWLVKASHGSLRGGEEFLVDDEATPVLRVRLGRM